MVQEFISHISHVFCDFVSFPFSLPSYHLPLPPSHYSCSLSISPWLRPSWIIAFFSFAKFHSKMSLLPNIKCNLLSLMLDYDILSAYSFPILSLLEFWWAVILLLFLSLVSVVFGEKNSVRWYSLHNAPHICLIWQINHHDIQMFEFTLSSISICMNACRIKFISVVSIFLV